MTNKDIAQALFDLADLAELSDDPDARFRTRALRMGGKTIEAMTVSAFELARRRKLKEVKGIGDGIVRRVEELASEGRLIELDELRASLGSLLEVSRVDGIGPTTTRQLRDELGVSSLDQLEAIARSGGLSGVSRFSAKRIRELLSAIDRARATRGRIRIDRAEKEAAPILDALHNTAGIVRAELAGSVRRRRDTIGDIDILVGAVDADVVVSTVTHHPHVEVVLSRGAGRTSIKTFSGMQIDVLTTPPEIYGAGLHHFTGSKEHNIAIRAMAHRLNLKVSDEGVFEDRGARRIGGAEEMEVFAALGLPWIPPEIRENTGEIERALSGPLPRLVELSDMRGDLHMHTNETDGMGSLEEMVIAAGALGREYIAITDHSYARRVVNGLDAERLRAQGKAIRELNERHGGRPRVLWGIEADILADGTVDLGPGILRQLDWVVGSVHSHFNMPRAEQTRRIITAIESGLIDALGHPTGRRIEERPPYDIDMEEIITAAARCDVALELNSNPIRLDMNDVHCRMARDRNAWIVVSTDSHAVPHLSGLTYGVSVARRAWLEAHDILNTRPVEDFLDLIRARRREAIEF
jgi:DNA polymerase (family X)